MNSTCARTSPPPALCSTAACRDCGVPLVLPCMGVTSHLQTTVPEIFRDLFGKLAAAA